MAHYPLDAEPSILYGPDDSNSDKLKAASTSLYKRLHRKGLLVDFHQEVLKSIQAGQMIILSKEEEKAILRQTHCFSRINF